MKHTHVAVGLIPNDLVNLGVSVQWTPGYARYTLTLVDGNGTPFEGTDYDCPGKEPFGYNPTVMDLDMSVYHGLAYMEPFRARFAQALAGFGFFQWFSPVDMPSKDREKYGAMT